MARNPYGMRVLALAKAEGEGFEPPRRLHAERFSRPAAFPHSHAGLRGGGAQSGALSVSTRSRRATVIAMDASSLTPMLTVKDAEAAIEFYGAAFDAVEHTRFKAPTGHVVAEMSIDGLRFFVVDENPQAFNLSPKFARGNDGADQPDR